MSIIIKILYKIKYEFLYIKRIYRGNLINRIICRFKGHIWVNRYDKEPLCWQICDRCYGIPSCIGNGMVSYDNDWPKIKKLRSHK